MNQLHGMADLVSYVNGYRHTEQGLNSLKKGARLLKYGRKGKPKFCPFRLSHDESSLIWFSSKGERCLKLALVSKIIPGQRTAVFRRYPQPEKDYLSFSLIYNNGKRSLDLICKDKVEAEVWIAGLESLISFKHGGRFRIDRWSDERSLYVDDNKDHISSSSSNASESFISSNTSSMSMTYCYPENIQLKGFGSDAFRVSVSSQPSTSSIQDDYDYDAIGDVYIWGQLISHDIIQLGPNKNHTFLNPTIDILLPKLLESDVVLDVKHISCGSRHTALVTRQGEVFTWGEESGGRLGHGFENDVFTPRPVESLSALDIDLVECGEFHTCAVTTSGELYTWGDGTHNVGILGHGKNVGCRVPKRVASLFDGVKVTSVACGPWHTGLITSLGQLFTFGDGTFGVLGHGDRETLMFPREVESLSGLRTVKVACGAWHTSAIVDVIVTHSSSNVTSGKLFTWGDGDSNCLGHGDHNPRLTPTCVSSLIDYNFHKVACGHSLTVGLTTSGCVFTMGSTVSGQLGNPQCDGKSPCLVQDALSYEFVKEIACGPHHVAVLTSRNELYTWGKGANGRLGHGDVEDRKTPTLVEFLNNQHVKFIACGSNYTSAICLHKRAERFQCSSCKQAFGFTKKRHNCYNCGLVHCHHCSSRKALRASLAPNPNKPHRVCNSCYVKLNKLAEIKERLDQSKMRLASTQDLSKLLNKKPPRHLVTNPIVASSRPVSPLLREPSPLRSATPAPTTSRLSVSKNVADCLKKQNDLLNREVVKLHRQIDNMRHKCEVKESELKVSRYQAQESMEMAAEKSAKLKAANDVIKSLTSQLKVIVERLPPGSYGLDSIKIPNGLESAFILQNPASTLGPTKTKGSTWISNGNDGYSDSRSLDGDRYSGVELENKYLLDHVPSQEEENGEFRTRNPASYNAPDQVEFLHSMCW